LESKTDPVVVILNVGAPIVAVTTQLHFSEATKLVVVIERAYGPEIEVKETSYVAEQIPLFYRQVIKAISYV
jgi:hypothetical protein